MENKAQQYIRVYSNMATMDGYNGYVISETPTERKIATFHFETIVDEGSIMPPARLILSHNAVQVLMDDLWRAGLRPTDGESSASVVKARQEHLSDLRTALHMLIGRLSVSDAGKSDPERD